MSRDGISHNELSKILGVDKGTTAEAMKKLTEAGYIKRKTGPCVTHGPVPSSVSKLSSETQ